MKFNELEDFCINIWEKFGEIDFNDEISSIKVTKILYGPISVKSDFYYHLGVFNYIYNVCSNYKLPGNKLNQLNLKYNSYFKYCFKRNRLVLVEHFENGCMQSKYYIKDNIIFQLNNDNKEPTIYIIHKREQIEINYKGVTIQQIKKINDVRFKCISIQPIYYKESLYIKNGKYFEEELILGKFTKSKKRIEYLNKVIGPLPVYEDNIDKLLMILKENGYKEFS